MSPNYLRKSDAVKNLPKDKNVLLTHIVNDIGAWGAGFVVAVSKQWPGPEKLYRQWYQETEFDYEAAAFKLEKFNFFLREYFTEPVPFVLGQIQPVPVGNFSGEFRHYVVNLIGQRSCGDFKGIPPIRYEAIREGFVRLDEFADYVATQSGKETEIHMPMIGAGLAGGKWEIIEGLINKYLSQQKVFVHRLD